MREAEYPTMMRQMANLLRKEFPDKDVRNMVVVVLLSKEFPDKDVRDIVELARMLCDTTQIH